MCESNHNFYLIWPNHVVLPSFHERCQVLKECWTIGIIRILRIQNIRIVIDDRMAERIIKEDILVFSDNLVE